MLGDIADVLALGAQDGMASAIFRRDIDDIARAHDLRQLMIIAPGDRLVLQPVALGNAVNGIAALGDIAGHLGADAVGNDGEGIGVQIGLFVVERLRRGRQQLQNLRRAERGRSVWLGVNLRRSGRFGDLRDRRQGRGRLRLGIGGGYYPACLAEGRRADDQHHGGK